MAKGFIDDSWNLINWEKRQFASDNSTKRVRDHREKKKQSGLFDETDVKRFSNGLDTEQIQIQNRTETETEKKQTTTLEPPRLPTETVVIREAVERVFDFYCMKFGRDKHRYALTADRRSKAESRMRERVRARLGDHALAETDLADAVFNLAECDYNRDNGFVDWTDHIFKSQDCFEKRMNWVKPKGGNENGNHKGKTGYSLDAAATAIQAFENRAAAERVRGEETSETGAAGLPRLRDGTGVDGVTGYRNDAPQIILPTARRV
jgi:hypothetical protein